jgi:hypothetical protein
MPVFGSMDIRETGIRDYFNSLESAEDDDDDEEFEDDDERDAYVGEVADDEDDEAPSTCGECGAQACRHLLARGQVIDAVES